MTSLIDMIHMLKSKSVSVFQKGLYTSPSIQDLQLGVFVDSTCCLSLHIFAGGAGSLLSVHPQHQFRTSAAADRHQSLGVSCHGPYSHNPDLEVFVAGAGVPVAGVVAEVAAVVVELALAGDAAKGLHVRPDDQTSSHV